MTKKDDILVITGAAGFIGSNLVKYLNASGYYNLILVDTYDAFSKTWDWSLKNAVYTHVVEPYEFLQSSNIIHPDGIFHIGATSDTMVEDNVIYFKNNYEYTIKMIENYYNGRAPKIINASSSAIYGNGNGPLNTYALSKKMIDDYILNLPHFYRILSLRFFNVFGMGEFHKGNMASMIYQLYHQYKKNRSLSIFNPGNQARDFIYVKTLVSQLLYYYISVKDYSQHVHDMGRGEATTFNSIIDIIKLYFEDLYLTPTYIPMPDKIRKTYQTNTCANIDEKFLTWNGTTLQSEIFEFYEELDKYYGEVVNEN